MNQITEKVIYFKILSQSYKFLVSLLCSLHSTMIHPLLLCQVPAKELGSKREDLAISSWNPLAREETDNAR